MKNNRLIIQSLVTGVVLITLPFGAKWIIFNPVLEKDDTARQPVLRNEP